MACGPLVALAFGPIFARAAGPAEPLSARLERDRVSAASTLKTTAGQPTITYGGGLSHDRDEDGIEVTNVPVYFTYRTASSQWWQFYAGTDGYTRVGVPGDASATGWSDLSLSLTRKLSSAFRANVSVLVPAHGEVGSRAGAQSVRLTWLNTLGPQLDLTLRGTLRRSDATADGVSRMSQNLYGGLTFTRGDTHTLDLWASRSHRSGALGRTELGADLGWAVSPQAWGTLSLFHGATAGARHTGVAVDVAFTY
jgi:hypothetical protein